MQLITKEYLELNKEKHQNSGYGIVGHYYSDEIVKLADKIGTRDLLDYGCGKSTLANALPFSIKQYDPAIKKYEHEPEPADFVVSTDVMEHIEPECLDSVLKHIHSKTKKLFYCSISTTKAAKTLSDGRNAHLIVENLGFWSTKIEMYFRIISVYRMGNNQIVIAEPLALEIQ